MRSTCAAHAAAAFADLSGPFYQVEARGNTLWAWNLEHLTMLHLLLKGESILGHPYQDHATYCRGSWLRRRADLAKAVQKVFEGEPAP